MRKVTLKIKNKNYTIANNQRSRLLYEKYPDKAGTEFPQNQMCEFVYCSLQANNSDKFKLSYEQFLDTIDDSPNLLDNAAEIFLPEATAPEKTNESKNA